MSANTVNITPPSPVLLLDRRSVSDLITLDQCVPTMEAAFAAHARGASLEPGLLHVSAKEGEFHIKAGGLTGSRTYFCTKINGGFFGNPRSYGLPSIIGVLVLCDGETGKPLSIMESGLITRLRTGAATAVAAKYLARESSRTVTVCGAGSQAEYQVRALRTVLPIDQVFIWSRNGGSTLASTLRKMLAIDVTEVSDLAAAVGNSDIVITCTPSRHPFLMREYVRKGTFVAAIGSDSPEKQELEPELLAASSVVPDLLNQALRVGDLHHAVEQGVMRADQIRGELGAVVAGIAPRRLSDHEIIIFDSTGTALQDTAVAAAVYERAVAQGIGQEFPFWG